MDVISAVPSYGLSQKVNAWTASYPCSWTYSTPCGSCISHPALSPDGYSQQAANASQLTEHMRCWRHLSVLWFGGTSSTDKEGSIVAKPKYMAAKLHTGGSGTQMETRKS